MKLFIRFLGAGVLVTTFNYLVSCTLVSQQFTVFWAQFFAMLLSAPFNYAVYTNAVFFGRTRSLTKFLILHIANYIYALLSLLGLVQVINNNYLLLFGATCGSVIVNFFVMNKIIYR